MVDPQHRSTQPTKLFKEIGVAKPNGNPGPVHPFDKKTVGFHYVLRVYKPMFGVSDIWNTGICLFNTVQPNLQDYVSRYISRAIRLAVFWKPDG